MLEEITLGSHSSSEISGKDIRTLTAQLAHPDDPLAGWKAALDQWIKANEDFRKMEDEKLFQPEQPAAYDLRLHRFLLHSLMSVGERLALELLACPGVPEAERVRQLSYVDAFLDSLRIALVSWHEEANPAHREMLAKFLC